MPVRHRVLTALTLGLCLIGTAWAAPTEASSGSTPDFSVLLVDLGVELEPVPPPPPVPLPALPVGPTLLPPKPLTDYTVVARGSQTLIPPPANGLGGDWVVNINTTPASLLAQVPHLDPIRADSIVAFREANGLFRQPEEVTEVFGISELILARLRPHLVCEGDTTFVPRPATP